MNRDRAHEIEELTPAEVARLLDERRILLVDVREPEEFRVQRIPGAVLAPLSTLDVTYLPPEESRHLVFHCGSGKRSMMAVRARLATGATRAAHMAGGIGAWVAAGYPVVQIDPATGNLVPK